VDAAKICRDDRDDRGMKTSMFDGRTLAAIREPLQGKTSLSRVVWVYGVLGSVAVSALGLLIDPGNAFAMHAYTLFGLIFGVYVTVASYRCASNCGSIFLARIVRVSAIISLLALPVLAYLQFTGAFDLSSITLPGEQ
jgi:hypothetical protein